jgi:hypothetical protein
MKQSWKRLVTKQKKKLGNEKETRRDGNASSGNRNDAAGTARVGKGVNVNCETGAGAGRGVGVLREAEGETKEVEVSFGRGKEARGKIVIDEEDTMMSMSVGSRGKDRTGGKTIAEVTRGKEVVLRRDDKDSSFSYYLSLCCTLIIRFIPSSHFARRFSGSKTKELIIAHSKTLAIQCRWSVSPPLFQSFR